ncbi:MAG TPA: hypothetical protein VGP89_17955 [Candidatus Angelobacter sp.]|jgi:hypothetical protein|nr:hypothetical protein [Candidatus Angelobacter sp.]
MTKLQIFALLVNLALIVQMFRSAKAMNNSGGEDAMGSMVETLFYLSAFVVFDVTATIIHFVAK